MISYQTIHNVKDLKHYQKTIERGSNALIYEELHIKTKDGSELQIILLYD